MKKTSNAILTIAAAFIISSCGGSEGSAAEVSTTASAFSVTTSLAELQSMAMKFRTRLR